LSADFAPDGRIQAVHLSYPRSVEQQYLDYASMYDQALDLGRKSRESVK